MKSHAAKRNMAKTSSFQVNWAVKHSSSLPYFHLWLMFVFFLLLVAIFSWRRREGIWNGVQTGRCSPILPEDSTKTVFRMELLNRRRHNEVSLSQRKEWEVWSEKKIYNREHSVIYFILKSYPTSASEAVIPLSSDHAKLCNCIIKWLALYKLFWDFVGILLGFLRCH